MTSYDALIIGGGHNGLVCAAYLARAGRRVLVLERRERVGGAAMSEEVFPGFRFSVFSYVVSLLRPEIIRDLDLPRHGLHILPLESTVTPMLNGDYLAGWGDHDQSRRELYRHSPHDADAYDEYGLLMQHMAQAVKPILGMLPPDPASLSPRDLMGMLKGERAVADAHAARIASLTPKELDVIAAVVRHRGAKSLILADGLGISEHTLRNHLTAIYQKLQVQGRLELYVYAKEHGLGGGAGQG